MLKATCGNSPGPDAAAEPDLQKNTVREPDTSAGNIADVHPSCREGQTLRDPCDRASSNGNQASNVCDIVPSVYKSDIGT